MFTIRTWSREGGGRGGRAMHFRRERLHTDRYIQRLDVTAHTHRGKYIYKCMYISEMPHWGRNVAPLYIYTQIHIHIFITWKMLSKGADGLGSKRSWSRGQPGRQGAAARVVCVPLSHLKHSVFNQFSHKYVCVYPKA